MRLSHRTLSSIGQSTLTPPDAVLPSDCRWMEALFGQDETGVAATCDATVRFECRCDWRVS